MLRSRQYADEETGWHYNVHRHYDPATGRYTSPDPLGLLPAPNAYTYPNNPLTSCDPLGLTEQPSVADRARQLGYPNRIPPQRAPFNSHGQPVFTNGKRYITPDVDGHNVSDGWKVFDRKAGVSERMMRTSTMSKSDGFSIALAPEKAGGDSGAAATEALGAIQIGEHRETFRASLMYWSAADYRRSWLRAFQVLDSGVASTSCLVTSITDPETSNFFFCWPLYRVNSQVFVQNWAVFFDELQAPFDPTEPWQAIGPRVTVNEDGDEISEWSTTMEALREFFLSPQEH